MLVSPQVTEQDLISPLAVLPLLSADLASDTGRVLGMSNIALFTDYNPTGAGGQPQFRFRWFTRGSVAPYIDTSLDNSVSPPLLFETVVNGIVTGANIDYLIYLRNPGGAWGLQVLVREVGTPLAPGSIGLRISGTSLGVGS